MWPTTSIGKPPRSWGWSIATAAGGSPRSRPSMRASTTNPRMLLSRRPEWWRRLPPRRWCRREPGLAPLGLVIARAPDRIVRLQTVIVTAAAGRQPSPPPARLEREVRLLRTLDRSAVWPVHGQMRIKTTLHRQRSETIVTHHTRSERVECIVLARRLAAAPGQRTASAAAAPPTPPLVVARTPRTPPPVPGAASPPALITEPGVPRPSPATASANALVPATPDLEQIADQVLRRIERRAIAQRERMGRG